MPASPPPRLRGSTLVNTVRFARHPLKLVLDAFEECGDVFSLRLLGMGEWVFLCSPDSVREMFRAPADVLDAGQIHRDLLGRVLGGDSTFNLDGEAHHQRQRLVLPLLNGPRIEKYVPLLRRAAEETLARWPENEPFSFLRSSHHIALTAIINAILGAEHRSRREQLAKKFYEFAMVGPRSPLLRLPWLQIDLGRFSPWGRIMRLRRSIRDAFLEVVEERVATRDGNEPPRDMLDGLLAARQEDGTGLTIDSTVDEILTLLFAGHETTGAALCWTIEALLSHPRALDRVRDEVQAVAGQSPIEAEHLPRLEFLHAAIHESLRLRAIAPMAAVRIAKKPFHVGPFLIPKGRVVAECLAVMGLRPDLFTNPSSFEPDRFLSHRPQRYEWTPFGGGHRVCVGKGFAQLELLTVLATLVQRCHLRLVAVHNPPVRVGHMMVPRDGLRVILEERR